MAALLAICSKRDREHGKRGQPTKDSVAKEAWALLDQHDQRTGAGWATRAGVKESTLRQNFAAWLVASGASAANGDKVILGALVQLAMDPNVRLDLTDAADVCAAVRKKRRKRLTGHHAGDFVATIEAALVFARDIADHASD